MADLLSTLYNSGPGWFNDIFEVDVFIETETEAHSTVPQFTKTNPFPPNSRPAPRYSAGDDDDDSDSEQQPVDPAEAARRSDGRYLTHYVPLVASGVPISGFVRITAPPGRTVPHSGISVTLSSHLFALEDVSTRDIYEETYTICGPAEVSGSTDLPFVVSGPQNEPLDESFEGALFSIRHQMTVTVQRPWYTFPVSSNTPFLVQRVHNLTGVLPEPVLAELAQGGVISRQGAAFGRSRNMTANAQQGAGAGPSGSPRTPGGAATGGGDDPLASAPQHKLGEEVLENPRAGGLPSLSAPQVLTITGINSGQGALTSHGSASALTPVHASSPRTPSSPPAAAGAGGKGVVTLELDRGLFEVRETIRGNLSVVGVTKPIVLLKLALVRMESADGEGIDTVLFDEPIVDSRRWKVRKDGRAAMARITEAAQKRAAERKAKGLPPEEVDILGRLIRKAKPVKADSDDDDDEEEEAEEEGRQAAEGDAEAGTAGIPSAGSQAPGAEEEAPVATIGVSTSDGSGIDESWMPSPEELALDPSDPAADPDLPLLGNQSLAVELNLQKIEGLSPTFVIPLSHVAPEKGAKKSSSSGNLKEAAAGQGGSAQGSGGEEEATVRYYVRLTAFTAFHPSARRWVAEEVVLVRGGLDGQVMPSWRRPPPPPAPPADTTGAGAGVEGGAAGLPDPLTQGLAVSTAAPSVPFIQVTGAGAAAPPVRSGGALPSALQPKGLADIAVPISSTVGVSPGGPGSVRKLDAATGLAGAITTPVSINSPAAGGSAAGTGLGGMGMGMGGFRPASLTPKPLTEADVASLRRK